MASYSIIYPNLVKLEELARLSFNLRYWTIEFRGSNGKAGKMGVENHEKMLAAERDLDLWLRKNINGVTNPITEE